MGYFALHAYRLVGTEDLFVFSPVRLFLTTVTFVAILIVVPKPPLLTLAFSVSLLVGLFLFRSKTSFRWAIYFALLSLATELVQSKAQTQLEQLLWVFLFSGCVGLLVAQIAGRLLARRAAAFKGSPDTEANCGFDPDTETLDRADLSIEDRWNMLVELDRINKLFGLYNLFSKHWKRMLARNLKSDNQLPQALSIFEVGSGSAELSARLQRDLVSNGRHPAMHLYDVQHEIVERSKSNLVFHDSQGRQLSVQSHVATEQHLAVFSNQSFDYVVSMQVLHHIRPLATAVSALDNMLRIAKHGVLILDFERQSWFLPLFKLMHRLYGVSPELASDGIKSMRRAYPRAQLQPRIEELAMKHGFRTEIKPIAAMPYSVIVATRL